MKSMRVVAALMCLLAVFSPSWSAPGSSASGAPPEPASLEAGQLLVNPDMEQAFATYAADCDWEPCQVAAGWTRFGDIPPRPCWMDARVFADVVMDSDWVEKIKGETSQVIFSEYPHVAGIYQQVHVTEGLPYGFTAAMMTIYQSSAQPRDDGHMIKKVGMDPTGGINPRAATVVWSAPDGRDKIWDVDSRMALVATSDTMTVFIQVESPYRVSWPYVNQSFLDGALLAQTATPWISSPELSPDETFVVDWGAQASDGGELWAYDVQWQDVADGKWHDWVTWPLPEKDLESEATFHGKRGHSYRFRVRAWQKYEDAENYLFSPWVATAGVTTVADARLVGKVWGNGDYGFVGGTRVSIVGTDYTATTRSGGSYLMCVDPMDDPHAVSVSDLPWLSPEPVYGVTFGLLESVTLDWTLRPPDDAVQNGGFEDGLTDWATVSEEGATPTAVGDSVHTGHGAVMLGGPAALSWEVAYRSAVEQTVSLARSWSPNISFWYLPETADNEDQFKVTLTVIGDSTAANVKGDSGSQAIAAPQSVVFSPALDVEGWQHQWYSLGAGDAYFTGTVTIQLEVWNDGDGSPTTVYVDEVSLGRTPGGPFRTYLPIVGE